MKRAVLCVRGAKSYNFTRTHQYTGWAAPGNNSSGADCPAGVPVDLYNSSVVDSENKNIVFFCNIRSI